MKTEEIKIEGMTCGHCIMAVKSALKSLGADNIEVEIGQSKI